jgi:hypothetical protein
LGLSLCGLTLSLCAARRLGLFGLLCSIQTLLFHAGSLGLFGGHTFGLCPCRFGAVSFELFLCSAFFCQSAAFSLSLGTLFFNAGTVSFGRLGCLGGKPFLFGPSRLFFSS